MQRFASLINSVLANGRGNVIRCLLQLRMPIAHSHADACGSHDLIIIHTVAKGDRVLQLNGALTKIINFFLGLIECNYKLKAYAGSSGQLQGKRFIFFIKQGA